MTATVSNLLRLMTNMGYPITVAAYLTSKKPQQRRQSLAEVKKKQT